MNETVKSMEKYFDERIAQTEWHSEESASQNKQEYERHTSRIKIRRLTNAADRLGINMSIFKENTSQYQIRPATEELFDCICFIDGLYGKKLAKKHFSDIPVHWLLCLRACLLSALYSAGLSESQVEYELTQFEKYTSCPAVNSLAIASELTQYAVEYWKPEFGDKVSCSDWEIFTRLLEETYVDFWRPRFIQFSHKKLIEFLQSRGYSDEIIFANENSIENLFSKETQPLDK